METIREIICKNCTRLIESSPMSQKTIATKVGVSEPTLYRWKSGENTPELPNIEALAKVLGVDPVEFYKAEQSVAPLHASRILRMIASVPDDVYEKAQNFDVNDEVWDMIRIAFKDREKQIEKQKAPAKRG